jgi:hypothetical protein
LRRGDRIGLSERHRAANVTNWYIIGGLAAVTTGLLVARRVRGGRWKLPDWVMWTMVGLTLGASAALGVMHALGYVWKPDPIELETKPSVGAGAPGENYGPMTPSR